MTLMYFSVTYCMNERQQFHVRNACQAKFAIRTKMCDLLITPTSVWMNGLQQITATFSNLICNSNNARVNDARINRTIPPIYCKNVIGFSFSKQFKSCDQLKTNFEWLL